MSARDEVKLVRCPKKEQAQSMMRRVDNLQYNESLRLAGPRGRRGGPQGPQRWGSGRSGGVLAAETKDASHNYEMRRSTRIRDETQWGFINMQLNDGGSNMLSVSPSGASAIAISGLPSKGQSASVGVTTGVCIVHKRAVV